MTLAGSRGRAHAIILAGGRGVRFWPRSRSRRPKQLLAPLGGDTLLRRTFDRVRKLVPPERVWILTSQELVPAIRSELGELPPARIVAEPARRNTAPAIGLAAALLFRKDPDAAMGVFPADHHYEDDSAYLALAARALDAASSDRLIVLGIKPRWPETGYGYIEFPRGTKPGTTALQPVVRFREKPDMPTARAFLSAGRFYWNSGQFFWKASALLEEMRRFLPETWSVLDWIASGASAGLRRRLSEKYGACDCISIDHAILERSKRISGFAAPDIGWTDLGSWAALHALLPKDRQGNCSHGEATFVRSKGNLVDAPRKHVALLGVDDLVIVDTSDALLVCRRSEAQEVGSVVGELRARGREDLV